MDIAKLRNEATVLFERWGLDTVSNYWTFIIKDTRKRALGLCKYGKKEIHISYTHAVNDAEETVLDTLKHEIAHALAGPHVPMHGSEWKQWAKKVGCSPEACRATVKNQETTEIPGRYFANCPCCQREFNWYRKPRHTVKWCAACGKEKGTLGIQERE